MEALFLMTTERSSLGMLTVHPVRWSWMRSGPFCQTAFLKISEVMSFSCQIKGMIRFWVRMLQCFDLLRANFADYLLLYSSKIYIRIFQNIFTLSPFSLNQTPPVTHQLPSSSLAQLALFLIWVMSWGVSNHTGGFAFTRNSRQSLV